MRVVTGEELVSTVVAARLKVNQLDHESAVLRVSSFRVVRRLLGGIVSSVSVILIKPEQGLELHVRVVDHEDKVHVSVRVVRQRGSRIRPVTVDLLFIGGVSSFLPVKEERTQITG